MSILCKIGLHDWEYSGKTITWSNSYMYRGQNHFSHHKAKEFRKCRRCGFKNRFVLDHMHRCYMSDEEWRKWLLG